MTATEMIASYSGFPTEGGMPYPAVSYKQAPVSVKKQRGQEENVGKGKGLFCDF